MAVPLQSADQCTSRKGVAEKIKESPVLAKAMCMQARMGPAQHLSFERDRFNVSTPIIEVHAAQTLA